MLAQMAQWAMIFGGGRRDDDEGGSPIVALVMMIVAPIAAMLVQMAISRTREYEADKGGAEIAGNPSGLANALLKLEKGAQIVPMHDAKPATAHMFIVNPLTGGGLHEAVQHPSADRGTGETTERDGEGKKVNAWSLQGFKGNLKPFFYCQYVQL